VLHCLKADDKTLLKHFARGFEPGGPMLEGLPHRRSAQGVAIVAGSLGHLELTPKGHVDSGDHRIFLAEVTGGSLEADEPPAVHIRKNGLNY
jgi:flavin reductase (DIM6/NTAB) family NADH-FMN oxidoreductase RutF